VKGNAIITIELIKSDSCSGSSKSKHLNTKCTRANLTLTKNSCLNYNINGNSD